MPQTNSTLEQPAVSSSTIVKGLASFSASGALPGRFAPGACVDVLGAQISAAASLPRLHTGHIGGEPRRHRWRRESPGAWSRAHRWARDDPWGFRRVLSCERPSGDGF